MAGVARSSSSYLAPSKDYFERDDGQRYGIEGADDTVRESRKREIRNEKQTGEGSTDEP